MLTILRGPLPSLAAHFPSPPPGTLPLHAALSPHAPIPWGALRGFLAQTRARLGDARVTRGLTHSARSSLPLLSLALRGLTPSLDAPGAAIRASRGALSLSALPNVILASGPLTGAWRDALVSLLAGERALLLIPEIDAIDLESLATLRYILAAATKDSAIDVVLGHDPSLRPAAPLDALLRAERLAHLALLEALPITRVTVVDASSASPSPSSAPPSIPRDPLDDGLEARAFDTLRAGNPADAEPLLRAAMRASFDAFGFDAALRFSDALETAGFHDDEVRTLGAFALHNLAPLAKEPWIGERLVATYTHLVATAREPLARAHWGYRLALAHGRTRGALDQALAAADAAVEDAGAAGGTARAAFVGAWTRNGRAYVKSRIGGFDGAAADTEAGFAQIEPDLPDGPDGVPPTELRVARILLANNRARVAESAGDAASLSRWRARTQAIVDALPPGERPGSRWFQPPEDQSDLAATVAQYRALLASARAELDPETEAIAAHGLGVALYKLREAAAAHEAFATSLRIWKITRGFAEDLLTEELNCAVTAYRSGQIAAAEEGFARVRANPLMQNDAAQAETLAALAMIAAKGGDPDKARARSRDAIRAADALGEPDVLVRVLRSAAEARLGAGERDEARTLIDRALATIAAVESAGGAIAPEDTLGAIVVALETHDAPDPSLARRAIALAPAALGDANAWWDAPRLLAKVTDLRRDPALAEPFAILERATAQRQDAAR